MNGEHPNMQGHLPEDERIANAAKALGWIAVHPFADRDGICYPGITLRQWLAGLAMQGILASTPDAMYAPTAIDAVAHADALLKELAK